MDYSYKNVAVTGYFGSGSSAVLDLLKEYGCVSRVPEERAIYEHVPFYYSGGLFDVCSLLSNGISPIGSDSVINHFKASMNRLYKNDFTWFGSYKYLNNCDFKTIVDEFIAEISTKKNSRNVNHYLGVRYSPMKAMMQIAAFIIKKRKIYKLGRAYIFDQNPTYFAMPTNNDLFKAARTFTSSYCSLFTPKEGCTHKVFDHLIWPQQIDAFENCFDDSFRFIVVTRDPRDMFILSKYIYESHGTPYFPSDVNSFIREWKQFMIPQYKSRNVLMVTFEDLIFKYSETIKIIEEYLGLDSSEHKMELTYFNPKESIENTQTFLLKKEWKEEVRPIEEQLSYYLYNFPAERVPDRKRMFDR